jgi:hypothetical protein
MSAAQGNGGQKIYLVPELDLIAVFTGSRYNTGAAPPNKIMAEVVLPAVMAARGVKGDVDVRGRQGFGRGLLETSPGRLILISPDWRAFHTLSP